MITGANDVLKGSPNERFVTPTQVHEKYPNIVIEAGILQDEDLKNVKIPESEVKRTLEVFGITKEYLQKLRNKENQGNLKNEIFNPIGNALGKGRIINARASIESEHSGKDAEHEADKKIKALSENPGKETLEKAKTVITEGVKNAKNVVEATAVMGKIKTSFEKAGNAFKEGNYYTGIGIALNGLFGSLFGGLWDWLKKFFGFGGKEKDAEAEKKEGKDIEDTQQYVREMLEGHISKSMNYGGLGKKIPGKEIMKNPILQKNLNKAINDASLFSNETWQKINEDKKNGKEINWKYLSTEVISPEQKEKFLNTILDPAGKEALRLQVEHGLIKSLETRYNINLPSEKRAEAGKILTEFKDNFNYNELADKVMEGKPIDGFELVGTAFRAGSSLVWLSLKLVSKGILTIGDIAIKGMEKGLKMIKFMTPFGVGTVSLEEYKKELAGKSDAEKGIQLGLLYRESGLFFDVISGALRLSNRLLLETVSGSPGFKSMYNAGISDFATQVNEFETLEQSIVGKFGEREGAVQQVKERLTKLTKYYSAADILREAENTGASVVSIQQKLIGLGITEPSILTSIKNATSLHELRAHLFNNIPDFGDTIRVSYKSAIAGPALDSFRAHTWNGFSKAVEDFNSKSRDVLKYIKARISGGEAWYIKPIRFFNGKKADEIMALFDLKRSGEKILLEGTQASQLTKIQAFSKLSQDAPDFFRTLFPGITGLTCMGLAFATAEEGQKWTKTAVESLMIMTKGLGPLSLVLNAGGIYDKEKHEIKWVNVAQSGVGTVLLGVDVWGYSKLIKGSHGFCDFLLKAGKYTVEPITDMGSFVLQSGKMGKNMLDVSRAQGSWKDVWKEAKISKRSKFILALMVLGGGSWYFYNKLYPSLDNRIKKLQASGVLDKERIPLSVGAIEFYQSLEYKEKIDFIDNIFNQKMRFIDSSHLTYEILGEKLTVKTKNPFIGEWVIAPEIRSSLEKIGIQTITLQNESPKKEPELGKNT